MKQREEEEQKPTEMAQPAIAGEKGGKVEPGAIIPPDNTMEKRGEGDRTDTEEMHRLNDDNEH